MRAFEELSDPRQWSFCPGLSRCCGLCTCEQMFNGTFLVDIYCGQPRAENNQRAIPSSICNLGEQDWEQESVNQRKFTKWQREVFLPLQAGSGGHWETPAQRLGVLKKMGLPWCSSDLVQSSQWGGPESIPSRGARRRVPHKDQTLQCPSWDLGRQKKKNQLTKKENKKKKMVGGPGKGKEGKDPALHDCPRAEGEARGVEGRSLWLNGRLKLWVRREKTF